MSKISEYRIVISADAQLNEMRAASFIRENIKLVCGVKLDLVKDCEAPVPLEIVVGKTSREVLDEMDFGRYEDGRWEHVLCKKGQRLYVTGLGTPPAPRPVYDNAYRKLNDGAVGTVLAAYHFVEDILKYDFVYAAFDAFPEAPALEMPAQYDYRFTRAALRLQRPQLFPGAAIYSLNCSERIDWNVGSFIIKTAKGKLIVIDGGHGEELPRLIQCLKDISGQEVPTVTAWLFSHIHEDHCGAFCTLTEEAWRDRVIVKDVYCNFLSRAYLTELGPEAKPEFGETYDAVMNSNQTLKANLHIVQKGDTITVDEVKFQVLRVPEPEYATEMRANDSSVVYKMLYDDRQSIMFLGDAEWIGSNMLMEYPQEVLKSDVVQVGHHGCGSVSRECYERIGAKVYIWQCGKRFWYQENGEGLNTHNVGYIRYRAFMKDLGVKNENSYVTMDQIHAFPLPIPIK